MRVMLSCRSRSFISLWQCQGVPFLRPGRGSLVLVQRARQQNTLFLTTGQRTPHIADQAVVAHRHAHDLFVDPGHLGV
jgi:hypothetical protein